MGRQFTITLPDELADHLREQVAAGEYASVEEAIGAAVVLAIDGNEAETMIPDEEMEAWLRDEVVPTLKRMDEDPSRAPTSEQGEAKPEARFRDILRQNA